jgi:hypothetical protein
VAKNGFCVLGMLLRIAMHVDFLKLFEGVDMDCSSIACSFWIHGLRAMGF